MQDKLSQNIVFVESFTPLNFKDTMGQLAVEVKYTNGDKDVLTTPMPPEKGSDKGDFKSEEEYFQFITYLKSNVK